MLVLPPRAPPPGPVDQKRPVGNMQARLFSALGTIAVIFPALNTFVSWSLQLLRQINLRLKALLQNQAKPNLSS